MSSPLLDSNSKTHSSDQLIQLISPFINPLGYQIIYLELQAHRHKVLRIYIDFIDAASDKIIGIEDCVKVTRALDERLDQVPEIANLLPGTYELEVSSPGVDRPLRTMADFSRFAGNEVRIHVYRPLTAEELNNKNYQEKNPKQKNFKGTLVGLLEDKVLLSVSSQDKGSQHFSKKSKASKKAKLTTNSEEEMRVTIPLPLISKANLEPDFDFERSDEGELKL